MLRAMIAGSLLILISVPVLAADNGIYIGGSVGQANVKDRDDLTGFDLNSDDTGFKVIAGIRPLDFLGFEANYVDFGQPQQTVAGANLKVDATGLDGFVVGFLPLPFVDLFAKAGVISWDAKASIGGLASLKDNGNDFAWGVGAQFRFGSLAARAEYEQFEIGDIDDVNLISVGLTWTFL